MDSNGCVLVYWCLVIDTSMLFFVTRYTVNMRLSDEAQHGKHMPQSTTNSSFKEELTGCLR